MKLVSLLPLNLREAEKEKEEKSTGDSEEASENPFAAADDAGSEDAESSKTDDAGGEEEKGDAKSTDEAKPLEVVFNSSKVKKYNDIKFRDNKGTVTNISRFGLTVTLPDQQTVFVNFEDIL